MSLNRDLPSGQYGKEQLDRVRSNTPAKINAAIDTKTLEHLQALAELSPQEISARILELEKEWDTERVLEANASVLAFTGLLLGIFVNPNWFWLTGVVLPFLFQHAIQGWCPPLPVIRRLGVRTRNEIDREKYALKILRGDFDSLSEQGISDRPSAALEAVTI